MAGPVLREGGDGVEELRKSVLSFESSTWLERETSESTEKIGKTVQVTFWQF